MITYKDLETLWVCLDVNEYPSYAIDIETNCYLPDAKSYYSLSQTPFFKPILDLLEDPEIKVISIVLPSQVGKSVWAACVAITWANRNPNETVLYYTPSESTATDFVNKKLRPIVSKSPYYANKIRKNKNGTDDRKALSRKSIRFDNGSSIEVYGANSDNSFISKTASLVIIDEYSAMGNSQKKRGDVLDLAKDRVSSKAYENTKVIVVSTPLNANQDIHKLWKESKQYQWHVPCPHCGTVDFLEYEHLKREERPKDIKPLHFADMIEAGSVKVWYQCPHCQGEILEREKGRLINAGEMVCTGNAHLSNKQISLSLNGLYAIPKWSDILARHLRALGDAQKLKTFSNSVLASVNEYQNTTDKLRIANIDRSELIRGRYPDDTIKTVIAVDVQPILKRFYITILAYTKSKKIHLIDWIESDFVNGNMHHSDNLIFSLASTVPNLDSILIDAGAATVEVKELVSMIPKATGIKGFDPRYINSYILEKGDSLLYIPTQQSNDLLEALFNYKTLSLPQGIDDKDHIFTHILNVVCEKGKYKDKNQSSDIRTDFRDCLRYAVSWIYHRDFSNLVDRLVYAEVNKEEIERKRAERQARLNSFSLSY